VEASGTLQETLAGEITVAARELEESSSFPRDYVRRVRTAAGAMAVSDAGDDPVRQAALLLEYQAVVDVEAPVRAGPRSRRLIKTVVKKLVGWYVRFLADQVGVLGRTAARLGMAVADRLERLDAEQAAMRAEVDAELARLRARVAELEAQVSGENDAP
jgi:hypothetical protein